MTLWHCPPACGVWVSVAPAQGPGDRLECVLVVGVPVAVLTVVWNCLLVGKVGRHVSHILDAHPL